MKALRRTAALFLCLCALLTFSACGGGRGYRVIDTFSAEGSYVIAFRQDDRICSLVTAALQELAHNGTLRAASYNWFGENLVSVRGAGGEMDEFWPEVEPRTITVGVDVTNKPMSYESAEGYLGFDVDLANYICGYLGWSMVIYPIDPANIAVELQSGNIDMAMGVSETDEVGTLSYSPTYLTSRYVLVSGTRGPGSRGAMKGKTLGVTVTDLDILQQDEGFVSGLESVTYQTNTDGLFRALVAGEVDAILVSSVVAAYYMNTG